MFLLVCGTIIFVEMMYVMSIYFETQEVIYLAYEFILIIGCTATIRLAFRKKENPYDMALSFLVISSILTYLIYMRG